MITILVGWRNIFSSTNQIIVACMQGVSAEETRITCTACAGTLLLEFGLLSQLTGNPIYEQKALHAARQVFGE